MFVQLREREIPAGQGLAALRHGEFVALHRLRLAGDGLLVAGHLGVEPLHALAELRPRPGAVLRRVERQQHHALAALGIEARGGALAFVFGDAGRQFVDPFLAVGAVAEGRGQLQVATHPRRRAEALRRNARLVDRRMRALHGLGQDLHGFADLPELAVVGDLLLGPGADDDVEALVVHPAAVLHRQVEAEELVRLVGAPGAEQQPPARQHVDQGEIRRRAQRVVERNDDDRGADLDPARPRGDGCGVNLGRGDDAVVREQVLGEPHRVEAQRLGAFEIRHVVGERFAHAVEVGDLAQAEHAPLHGILHSRAPPRRGAALCAGAPPAIKPRRRRRPPAPPGLRR